MGLALRVANTGCRLNDEQMLHVFERFWRADEARSSTGVHTGLGLALCRKIIDLRGGDITARSSNGRFIAVVEFGNHFVEWADEPGDTDSENVDFSTTPANNRRTADGTVMVR